MTDESLIGHIGFGFLGITVTLFLLYELLQLRQAINQYGAPYVYEARTAVKVFAALIVITSLLFLAASLQVVAPYYLANRVAQAGMVVVLFGVIWLARALRKTII